jgi:hypothetical protein
MAHDGEGSGGVQELCVYGTRVLDGICDQNESRMMSLCAAMYIQLRSYNDEVRAHGAQ